MIVPSYSFPKDPFERMDITPEVYRNRVLQMAREYIDSENIFCENEILSINKRLEADLEHLENLKRSKKASLSIGTKLGTIFGAIIGGFLGVGSCVALCLAASWSDESLGLGGIFLFPGMLVGGLFIGRANGRKSNDCTEDIKRYEQKKQELIVKAETLIDNKRKASSARCDKCKTEAVAVIEQYTHVFESEARKLSLEYLESPAIDDIANWIADEFAKDILRIDRSKTVESFGIYLGIITRGECVALYAEGEEEGVYRIFDFNEHRYPQLDSVLRIAAVAKVLTQAVLMILVERYPEDVAGGATQIELKSEEYAEDAVLDHIRYSAVNGNYEPIMHW